MVGEVLHQVDGFFMQVNPLLWFQTLKFPLQLNTLCDEGIFVAEEAVIPACVHSLNRRFDLGQTLVCILLAQQQGDGPGEGIHQIGRQFQVVQ